MSEPDDISKWAESLTPDGTPGLRDAQLRAYLGDSEYEKTMALAEASTEAALRRINLVNSLLSVAVLFWTLMGIVMIVAAVVATLRYLIF